MTPFTTAFLHALSRLLGWSYFLSWGISFYPQLLSNRRRKSVKGLALDLFIINVLGFALYTVSSILFLFSPTVRAEYALRHPQSPVPTVRINDLFFAAHALLLSSLTLSQFYVWGYAKHARQKVSYPMLVIIASCATTLVVSIIRVDGETWMWLDVVYTLAYLKLLISIIKYLPQAFLNYKRQSTIGWSIHNILLDLSGGILSLAQLVIDSSMQSDWSGLAGNPVKFFLSQITIVFDGMFITQHYVLYPGREEDGEQTPLIDEEVGGAMKGGGATKVGGATR